MFELEVWKLKKHSASAVHLKPCSPGLAVAEYTQGGPFRYGRVLTIEGDPSQT